LGKVNSVEETNKKLEGRDMNPGKGQTRKATLSSILQKLFFNAGLDSWINFSDIVASKKWTQFTKTVGIQTYVY
jgi:hypothetical protein